MAALNLNQRLIKAAHQHWVSGQLADGPYASPYICDCLGYVRDAVLGYTTYSLVVEVSCHEEPDVWEAITLLQEEVTAMIGGSADVPDLPQPPD